MTKKFKHIDTSCIRKNENKQFRLDGGNDFSLFGELGYPPGQFCTALDEIYPQLEQAGCEVVYGGNNNSEIVFGRDRPASLASGRGGSGGTRCGMIDIVAGRLACLPDSKRECERLTSPNFTADAARIYITERGDIDTYFSLPMGLATGGSAERSAIGIKSDHTRIIGRETVRIYAGKSLPDGVGKDGELNSLGGKIKKGIIELVAGGYYDDIQPAVLGTNLISCLRDVYRLISQAFSAIHVTNEIQKMMISMVGKHTHAVVTPVGPGYTSPDVFLEAVCFSTLAKSYCVGFDQIMSEISAAVSTMKYTGIGDPEGFFGHLPGAKDILSTSVYLT